jgi:hypothetical protein
MLDGRLRLPFRASGLTLCRTERSSGVLFGRDDRITPKSLDAQAFDPKHPDYTF